MTIKQLRKELDKMSKKDLKLFCLGASKMIDNLGKEKEIYKKIQTVHRDTIKKLLSLVDEKDEQIRKSTYTIEKLRGINKVLQKHATIKATIGADEWIAKELKC